MLRFIHLTMLLALAAAPVAWGHDAPGEHAHVAAPVPIAEICAGLALILSAASFWMCWRMRRVVADLRDPR